MTSIVLLLATAVTAGGPSCSWKQTDHSLALMDGDRVVWQFNYAKGEGKPYFHPLSIAGSEPLTDQRPADHPWHHGLWFSWKTINGLAYWDEDRKTGKSPGETELVQVQATPGGDHSAGFELSLAYHPPGKPAVLTEKRVVAVGAPDADGSYRLDWTSTFTATETDVLLGRTPILGEPKGVAHGGYAGLSLRLAPGLRGWQFTDSQGPIKDRWKQARWMSFAGTTKAGKPAAIVVFDHPQNMRHPTPWYLIGGMPYFSPAVLYLKPYTLPAHERLTLKYRILVQAGPVDGSAIDRQWQRFAEGGTSGSRPIGPGAGSPARRPQ
jgi:hypothetical protein